MMITVNFENMEIKLHETLPLVERLAAEKSIYDALKDIEYGSLLLRPAITAMYFLMYYAEDFTMPMVSEGDKASPDMDFMHRFDTWIRHKFYNENDDFKALYEYMEIYEATVHDIHLYENVIANAPANELVYKVVNVLDVIEEQIEKVGFSIKKVLDKTQKQVNRKNLGEFLKNLEDRMVGEIPKWIKEEAAAETEEPQIK